MDKYDWTLTIRRNIFILKHVGLWPTENYGFNFYTVYAVTIIALLGFAQCFFQTAKLLSNLNDLEIITGTAFLSISESLAVLKMFYLAQHVKEFQHLLGTLDNEMFQPRNESQISSIRPNLRIWRYLYNLICGSINIAIIFWFLVPFLDKSFEEHVLPYLAWYPYDSRASPFFEFTYVHQFLSITFIANVNLNIVTLIGAFSMYTGAQLDILSDNVRNLQPDSFKENLVVCVKHHREIINFAKSFNLAFNWSIFVQFFASAISIGFSMFLLTTVPPFGKEFFSVIFYVTAILVEIFIFCWFGNEIQIKSSQVPIAAYESEWVTAPLADKKDLIFFMMKSQRSLKISALNLFELSLENFLKILKTSWTYFALVSNLNE